jgi:hypothetical protein
VLAEVKKAGFPSPTAIQSQTWPIILQGRDLIVRLDPLLRVPATCRLPSIARGYWNFEKLDKDPIQQSLKC